MGEYKGVEDTLFIPLTARVNISKKYPEYFYDEKALEMEALIRGSSADKKSSEYAQIASVARYYNFDEMTQAFIDRCDKCNIVNLGVGLETSYFRLNRKNSIIYELDLPHVIELRNRFIKVGENEKVISGDLFDLEWCNKLDTSLPTLLVVSGVFQYFHENDILNFIKGVKEIFDDAELIFDSTSKLGLNYTNFFVKRTGNSSAVMYFYVNDAEEFARKTDTQLMDFRVFFSDAQKILKKSSLYSRVSMKVSDRYKMAIILHLKL